jgi:glc operon protein GlcG
VWLRYDGEMLLSRKLVRSSGLFFFPFIAYGGRLTAQSTLTVQVVNEAGSRQAIEAAEHAAERLHAPCAIAVVDRSGILVAFTKMDGVRDGSTDLAIGKARTSALLQRPSGETETNVNEGRTAFVTAGFMALRGGMPLLSGGQVVGAIGIAGLNKDTDVAIAESAAKAFASQNASSQGSR